MPHIKKTTKVRDRIYVQKCYSARYGKHTIPGEKKKQTKESIRQNQQRQRVKKLSWLIEENFEPGDWHITLTFKKENRTKDKDRLQEIWKYFMKELKKAYKKEDVELKYIKVCEHLTTSVHYHLILNDLPMIQKVLPKIWKQGRVNFAPLYDSDDKFLQLASYLVKEKGNGEKEKGTMSYTHSRNLRVPETKVEIVKSMKWRKDPKPIKGYYVEKSSVYSDYDANGYWYQNYTMVKIGDDDS